MEAAVLMKPVVHLQDGIAYFNCPACGNVHGPAVDGHRLASTGAAWGWNGDVVRPTFTPSLLVRGTKPVTDEEVDRIMAGEKIEPVPTVCHSFVRDGQIEFLSDCTHALAGKMVPIGPWND